MADLLPLDPDQLLTTTRAVRKRLDLARPVDREVVEECIEIAMQAPSGSNRQTWQFVLVDDPDTKSALAEIYRSVFDAFSSSTPAASLRRGRHASPAQGGGQRIGHSTCGTTTTRYRSCCVAFQLGRPDALPGGLRARAGGGR